MGMFDYVSVDCRLPCKRETELRQACNPFQSKSVRLWQDPVIGAEAYDIGGFTITLAEDKTLRAPNGDLLWWSGSLNFYGSGQRVKWAEFTAEVLNGVVLGIRVDELPERFLK